MVREATSPQASGLMGSQPRRQEAQGVGRLAGADS